MTLDLILVYIFRIFLSFSAGFILGLERKVRRQVIGMRTLILICESSTLLSILSVSMAMIPGSPGGDTTRIAAGVISGIGFVGGGAIMKQGLNIKGLTTAAIIWTSAAIGLAIGAGLYIPAFVVLFVSVVALLLLEKLEERYFPAGMTKSFRIAFEGSHVDMARLRKVIESHGFITADVNISWIIKSGVIYIQYSVKAPKIEDFSALIDDLGTIGTLTEFSVTD